MEITLWEKNQNISSLFIFVTDSIRVRKMVFHKFIYVIQKSFFKKEFSLDFRLLPQILYLYVEKSAI